jgi:hypothetical protein
MERPGGARRAGARSLLRLGFGRRDVVLGAVVVLAVRAEGVEGVFVRGIAPVDEGPAPGVDDAALLADPPRGEGGVRGVARGELLDEVGVAGFGVLARVVVAGLESRGEGLEQGSGPLGREGRVSGGEARLACSRGFVGTRAVVAGARVCLKCFTAVSRPNTPFA